MNHTNSTTECFTVEAGTIKVIKDFVGAPEGAKATLQIKQGDTVKEAGQKGDGGFIGPKTLLPGAYTVGEISSAADVSLGLYTTTIECSGEDGTSQGTSASVTLSSDEHVVCTITNTRKARSITVEKSVSATSDGTYVKSPDKATKPENGGTFYFKLKITNTSSADTIEVGEPDRRDRQRARRRGQSRLLRCNRGEP